MSRSKHCEAEIIAAVKQLDAGCNAENVAWEVGISTHTIMSGRRSTAAWT